jgi:hypothetical protein
MLSRRLAPLALVLPLAAAAGCGGDDEPASVTAPAAERTTPRIQTAPAETATTQTQEAEPPSDQPTETQPAGEGQGGGTPGPAPEQPADSPTNDVPPPADSPAERFERYCEEHPGACG